MTIITLEKYMFLSCVCLTNIIKFQSPYEAMFGEKMRTSINTSLLPQEVWSTLETEDDLISALGEVGVTLETVDTLEEDQQEQEFLTEQELLGEPVSDTEEQHIYDVPVVLQDDQDISSIQSDIEIEIGSEDIEIGIESVIDSEDANTEIGDENDEGDDLNTSNHEEEIDKMIYNHNTDSPAIEVRKEEILTRRKAAKRGIEDTADKMIESSSKRLKIIEVGESCTLRIPEVDRGRGDFGNVMVLVMDIDEKGMITLGSKFGILEGRFTRAELVSCGEKFLEFDNIPDNLLSVRELARKESNGTGQGFFKCSCMTKCTGRCKCKRNNVLCNSKCHVNRSTCSNKNI